MLRGLYFPAFPQAKAAGCGRRQILRLLVVADYSGSLLAILIDPLGVHGGKSDASVRCADSQSAILNSGHASMIVKNGVEIICSVEVGGIPY